jgi:hypothetical protein
MDAVVFGNVFVDQSRIVEVEDRVTVDFDPAPHLPLCFEYGLDVSPDHKKVNVGVGYNLEL